MYYFPPVIELPCYIRYADGTVRDLGEMCGVRSNATTSPANTPTNTPTQSPAQSPGSRRDSDRDISEGMRIARGTPAFMSSLSTRERIEAYYGPPERSEQVNSPLPDYFVPVAYWWTVRARFGTPIARIRVLFTNEDRVALIPRIEWIPRN